MRERHDEAVLALAVTASSPGKSSSRTTSEWYRAAANGLDMPRRDRGPCAFDPRALAVTRRGRADDRAAVGRRDRLVAEADAEERDAALSREPDRLDRAAGRSPAVPGRAR